MAKGIKTGGRQKGSLNANTRQVKDVLATVFSDLQSDNKVNLKSWAKGNPTEFYKLAAKLIPTQMEHSGELAVAWNEIKNYGSDSKTNEGN